MTRTNRKVQYMAGVCASLFFMFTGATFSWASPAIPKFKSGETNIIITDAQTSWVVSLLSLGALPGCYVGQLLIERIGRKWAILSSALPGVIGSLMMLFTTSPPVMYAARLVLGLSIGIIAAATILYVTEIADKEVRGSLGMLVQVMYNIGSLIVYGIGPFVSYTSLNCIILAIPLLCTSLCLWIPESPYFYLKDGKIEMARKTFKILNAAKDEKWVDDQLGMIQANVRTNMENNKTSLKELLTNMKYRNALYIVAGLKVLQYMTGSLAIQSYLEMIFRQSSSISGPNASIFYGFVQLGAGIGATFLVRWFGRRTLMSISCLGVAMSLTAVGIYFYLQDAIRVTLQVLQSISILPLVGILSFNILYAIGNGNIPYIMQAELFPINVKSLASSLATMAACVFNFTIIKCYQGVKDSFGHYTVFWSFAFVGYVGVLFVYLYLPETKGKTLEEVQENMEEIAIEREALRSSD